jgi:hypothetical protein
MKGEKSDKIPVILQNFMGVAKEVGVSMSHFRDNPKYKF